MFLTGKCRQQGSDGHKCDYLGRRHPLFILYIITVLFVTVMLFAVISDASIKIQVIKNKT